jgi:hypothetical protein
MRGERSSTSPDMIRLVVLPPEHGASAYLNIRCRDERSGRECLQRGLNLTTNKRIKMGVRASPVRGRGGGCAEAPLAGLPPHGPPSLTQSAAEVAPTGATATRAGSSACIFVSGRCSLSVYRTDALLRRTCRFHAAQSTSYTSTNSLRRLRGERTPLVRS